MIVPRPHIAVGDAGLVREEDAHELKESLAALHAALKRLLELAGRKFDALRRADAAVLQQIASEEGDVLAGLLPIERRREAVLARLAQSLRRADSPPLRLSDAAEILPRRQFAGIQARIEGLRAVASELEKRNRVAAAVARNLQSHVRSIFAAVAKANQESVVYGRGGQHETRNTRSWVDAVG